MGYDFTPNTDNLNNLVVAVNDLGKMLEDFIKDLKGFTGISLEVKDKHRPGKDPLGDDWYDYYPYFVQGCELSLTVKFKGGLLSKGNTLVYARAKLDQLPACCGICILNSVEIHSELRGNGIGKEFVKTVEAFAKVLNYSYVMCTTHKVNGPAIGVVECLGYTELDNGFANMRTKNSIRMFGKNINPEGISLTDGYLDLKEN